MQNTAVPRSSTASPLFDLFRRIAPLADPIMRLALGGILFMHGFAKLEAGHAAVTAAMAKGHFEPASLIAYWIMFLETVGALAVIFGVFTRFFAVCLAIEMAVIAFVVQFSHGFLASKGGYEFTLMWSAMFIVLALRGAGAFSVDRKMGWDI